MTNTERMKPPSKRHKVGPVMNVTDRAFNRNIHSIVHTYLKLSGEKRSWMIKDFYPPSYKSSRRKLRRTA